MEDSLSLNSTNSSQPQQLSSCSSAGPGGQQLTASPKSTGSTESNLLLIRIGVPELTVEKCLQYQKDEVIWEVKQQALAALPKVKTDLYSYILL